MHNLTKAGGPMLESVINELAVMQLPLPPSDADTERTSQQSQEINVQLRNKPTHSRAQYMRPNSSSFGPAPHGHHAQDRCGQASHGELPDGAEKIELLGQITKLETLRPTPEARVFLE